MRFRRTELLEKVIFFFYEMYKNETRYARTDAPMLLKKNTVSLVVLALLQMRTNQPLAPDQPF